MSPSSATDLAPTPQAQLLAQKLPAALTNLPTLQAIPEAPPVKRLNHVGYLMIALGFVGFILWSSLLPLAGGAYATGAVRLSDEKQVVAHVEGGIIRRLAVSEGDKVSAGQELVVLDDYNSETNLAILEKRRWELMARKARLEAVRDNWAEIEFPEDLAKLSATPAAAEIMATQTRQFKGDKLELDGQKSILSQQVAQYNAIIESLTTQIKANDEQIALIAQEAAGVAELLAKGLERRPRLLALQRQQAALGGQKADYEGRIASYNEKIGEINLQLAGLDADRRANALAELSKTESELNQTQEQWSNATLRSRELTLRATQDGTVLNLRYRSEGAVVPRGEPIMDIVPASKQFVVDAQVSPMDIDVVHEGLKAQVRLSGLKQRTHVNINGTVLRVSPDAIANPQTGQTFFDSRVTFDTSDPEFKKLEANGELYAGMPADVVFIAHERSLLQYLMQPVADSFARSFHED
jgi:HlyD family secretion protein